MKSAGGFALRFTHCTSERVFNLVWRPPHGCGEVGRGFVLVILEINVEVREGEVGHVRGGRPMYNNPKWRDHNGTERGSGDALRGCRFYFFIYLLGRRGGAQSGMDI